MTRTILAAIGVRNVHEAPDGITGLEVLKSHEFDLIIVDWEMPVISGLEFVQLLRTPGEFANPDIPVIILTAHSDHWRVVESAKVGANEFIRKPVSIKTIEDRILSILSKPRPVVQLDGYYGPMPRKLVHIETYQLESKVADNNGRTLKDVVLPTVLQNLPEATDVVALD